MKFYNKRGANVKACITDDFENYYKEDIIEAFKDMV